LGRSLDKHIDNQELDALVPSWRETGREPSGLSQDTINEAARHVGSCTDCSGKVSKYRRLVNRKSSEKGSQAVLPETDCPKEADVDWREVAAGLWPEWKARQLIMHAALCAHCGPLLRAATSALDHSIPDKQDFLAAPKASSWSDSNPALAWRQSLWHFMKWLIPAASLVVILGVFGTRSSSPRTPMSGPQFAEFAVSAHKQHIQGKLALDIHSDSQQALNEWFTANSQFSLALPESPAAPGEVRPYRLEGARLVQVNGNSAVVISYQVQTSQSQMTSASLVVIPDSVAVASGGVQAGFKKVNFHYLRIERYKVVTWSQHGLTYALVSQEGNGSQRSCMLCHSAMKDRDLSQTPTPLPPDAIEPVLQ
jgi:hypothetical protein